MDEFELTSMLFDKITSMDPENALKIMGYILIQDLKERDLLCLTFGSETLLQSLILKAKTHLGLSSNTSSAATSPSPSPIARLSTKSNNVSKNPFAKVSPRITNVDFARSSSFSDPKSNPFLSYENIRSGSCLVPSSVSHLKNSGYSGISSSNDFLEELQFNDYLSFLDESSKGEEFSGSRSQMRVDVGSWGQDMSNVDTHLHKRSFSASDEYLGFEDSGLNIGYRPCLYYARGFCKNGENCKFVHGGFGDNFDVNGVIVGSPSTMDGLYLQHEDMMMRLEAAQQQRLAASQFAAGVSPLPYDKSIDFLLQQKNTRRATAAAVMLGDEFYKFGHGRPERNDYLAMALAEKVNSANRQIYLTFPADSTFKDEDVSNYFSNFGPVQDVRIPYQPKRMFGFFTFVFPETVKLILARGNPHFICDSRVLVKPYKEKGKIAEKGQQQFERGNLSPCSSPSASDSRDPYDLHLGAKMLYHTQEIILRRKLEEQNGLQQAIEFQRRSVTAKVPSTNCATTEHAQQEVNAACIQKNGCGNGNEGITDPVGSVLHERSHDSSVELSLPDSLLASRKKPAEGHIPVFSPSRAADEGTAVSATPSSESNPEIPITSTTDMASY